MVLDNRTKWEECITIAPQHTPQALCRIRNEVSGSPLVDEDLANANLIAAAPDLLEELEWMLGKATQAGWPIDLLKPAQEAIKKARGDQ
jgi:hypothetical protein